MGMKADRRTFLKPSSEPVSAALVVPERAGTSSRACAAKLTAAG